MALLIMNLMTGEPEDWRQAINADLPDLEIRFMPDAGDVADIEYLAFGRPNFDELPDLPNLKLMLTRQAGVDGFAKHPRLPKVPLTKLEPVGGDPMMTEYVITNVLRHHRQLAAYKAQQHERVWQPLPQVRQEDRRVGFMGYGTMAQEPARILQEIGFDVAAWTRTPRDGVPVENFHGADGLEPFLNRTDIVVCLLPLTAATDRVLNAKTLAMLPEGAMVISLGRGDHVVQEDLVAALDSGHLAGATLDVTSPEPLPEDSPLWEHSKINIMPHIARRPPVSQLAPAITANIKLFEAGEALPQLVDLEAGY